jgi:hypothetical protein
MKEGRHTLDELLPVTRFMYNNHIHSSTQQVPVMMDTGRCLWIGFKPNGLHSAVESINKFCDQITSGVSEAKATLVKAKDQFKCYYDCWCIPAPEIKVGD